jgi:hypothetical protein
MTWVPREIKERFGACARALGISESALLKRLVIASLWTGCRVELAHTGSADISRRTPRADIGITTVPTSSTQ